MQNSPANSKYILALSFAGLLVVGSLGFVITSVFSVYSPEASTTIALADTKTTTPKVLGATSTLTNCDTPESYLKKVLVHIPDVTLRYGTEKLSLPTSKILNCKIKVNEIITSAQACKEFSLSIDDSCLENLLTSTYHFSEPTELIRNKKTGGTVDSRIADKVVDYATLADTLAEQFQRETTSAALNSQAAIIRSPTITASTISDAPSTNGKFASRYLEFDGSRQLMFMWEDGQYKKFRISGAFKEYNPVGIHQIFTKSTIAWSRPTSKWMPYWQAFTFDPSQNAFLGIHALVYWYPGLTRTGERKIYEPESNIGKPASTGCLRLTVEDAKKVYDWTKVGDYIVVHN